jgi:hypothetical protein
VLPVEENLGRISRNESEEIRVSLQEIQGDLYVELRVSARPARQGRASLPQQQAIVVPLDALPDLCRVLVQAQDHVLRDGLMQAPSRAQKTITEAGEAVALPGTDPRAPRRYHRREPRIPVRLPVECYFLSTQDSSPSEPMEERVTGEMKDVSGGGAQVWLSEHFPPPSHVAVFMRIGKLTFRGQAEVVESASQPKDGKYRHNLRWLSLNDQAKAALTKLIGTPR